MSGYDAMERRQEYLQGIEARASEQRADELYAIKKRLRAAVAVAQGKISMRSNDEALNHLMNEISRILDPHRWVGR